MRVSSIALPAALGYNPQGTVGARFIFGLMDRGEMKWDGTASARSGHIAVIEPRRFEGTVRGAQDNGEIVWASPMWIPYTAK
jgi:hypothetical protein